MSSDYKRVKEVGSLDRSLASARFAPDKSGVDAENEPILKRLVELYGKEPELTESFLTSKWSSGRAIVGMDGTNFLYGDTNKIMSYNWSTNQSKEVYVIPDTDPNNIFIFTALKDGRLFIADMN